MSLYVLDTDILGLLQEGHASVSYHALLHAADTLAVTAITIEEQLSGWYTLLRRAKDRSRLAVAYQSLIDSVHFLAHFRLLTFDVAAMSRFDQLTALKLGVRHMDLRIAAIALEHGATLVTRNMRDFQNVPSLQIENWAV
jgi:tRNA(fMet)-specific endonuclease VapC